jgi:hypothetical protein
MVKNVLIGKDTARRPSRCTIVGRFVGLRFILRQAAWLTAGFAAARFDDTRWLQKR